MKEYDFDKMKNLSLFYLIAVSLLTLASCSSEAGSQLAENSTNQEPDEGIYELRESQFVSSKMQLGKLEMKMFHGVVKANGVFDVPPENQASVGSYFGGTVKDLRLLPGERVRKGQLLFTLENPEFVEMQQDFLEAKSQLTYLKSDYERQKNLVQDNVSSQKSFLKAESDYMVTRVKVESLSKKLMLMNIDPDSSRLDDIQTTINVLSPIKGYVTRVGISKGSFLVPSQSAVDIVNTDHLHLELNIFENDLTKVSIGQPIKFRIQEDNGSEYDAFVHLVNKIVDPDDRTIGIHGHLADEGLSSKFNPGMYVEADIYSSSESKAALPEDALVEMDGQYFALILEDVSDNGYVFMRRNVRVGSHSDDYVEILNPQDFPDNTEFLVKGAFNLILE